MVSWPGTLGFPGLFLMRILSLLFALALTGCATTDKLTNGVPNFQQVSPGVYRGGQPTEAGWVFLRNLGVTNVLKLNLRSEGVDDYAEKLGMTIHWYPIDMAHQAFVKPNSNYVWLAVGNVHPGTYVHCLHGQDRTGLIVGCERVWVEKWPKDVARREMLELGFHRSLHGLDDFWEDDVK